MNIKYAYWEELAVRLEPSGEAWLFNEIKKEWVPMNAADAMSKARLLTEAEFNEMYPDLPPLPTEAFKG
jgi:hypothetical protein